MSEVSREGEDVIHEDNPFRPNRKARQIANQYCKDAGFPPIQNTPYYPYMDPEAKRIAEYFDQAPDDPENPEIQEAYAALAAEVAAQYELLPVTIIWVGDGEYPYKDSKDMIKDVERGQLAVYTGGSDHSILTRDENNMFRAVHDYFGHASIGVGFGPIGEFNAWMEHSKMFSPIARKALTCETRMQNAFVNAGPFSHLPITERPYAQQKVVVVPPEWTTTPELSLAYERWPEFYPTYELVHNPHMRKMTILVDDDERDGLMRKMKADGWELAEDDKVNHHGEILNRLVFIADDKDMEALEALFSNPPYEEVRAQLVASGVPAETIEFLDAVDDPAQRGRLLNAVKKNKNITIVELSKIVPPKRREPTVDEKNAAIAVTPDNSDFAKKFRAWMELQFIKHRDGYLQSGHVVEVAPGEPARVVDWSETGEKNRMYRYAWPDGFAQIYRDHGYIGDPFKDMAALVGGMRATITHMFRFIRDWAVAERPEMASYDLTQASEAALGWHAELAAKKSAAAEGAYATDDIVYEYKDHWKIVQVPAGDCEQEGELMGHCVGGYAEAVARGETSIYSLRDPKNKPHATLEIEGLGHKAPTAVFIQIQGKQNREPIAEYKTRLKEWIETLSYPQWRDADTELDVRYTDYGNWPELIERWYEKEQNDRSGADDYGISGGAGDIEEFDLTSWVNRADDEAGRGRRHYWVNSELADVIGKLAFKSDVKRFEKRHGRKPTDIKDMYEGERWTGSLTRPISKLAASQRSNYMRLGEILDQDNDDMTDWEYGISYPDESDFETEDENGDMVLDKEAYEEAMSEYNEQIADAERESMKDTKYEFHREILEAYHEAAKRFGLHRPTGQEA
jgi:hypothetical protein